jgi:hypothetical protein
MRKTLKTRLAPPQRRHAGDRKYRLKPRVLFQKRVDRGFEIGLAVEVEGHCDLKPSFIEIEINAATRFPFCAVSERLPASWSRFFGDAQFRPCA